MRAPDPTERELIGLVMVAIGVAFAGVALFFTVRVRKRLRESIPTTGRIARSIEMPATDSKPAYKVVVQFTDEQGTSRTFQSRSASGGWKNAVGEDINIIYLRDSPTDARIHVWWVQWLMVAMMAGSAIVSLAVAIVILLFPEI